MPGDLQEMTSTETKCRENMSRNLSKDLRELTEGKLFWSYFDMDDVSWMADNLAEHADYLRVFGHLGKTPDEIGNLIISQYDAYEAKIEQLEEQIRKLKHEHQLKPSSDVPGTDS